MIGWAALFSSASPAAAIGTNPFPRRPIEIIQENKYQKPRVAPIVPQRWNKIRIDYDAKQMFPLIYLNGRQIYINEEILKGIRAGDFGDFYLGMFVFTLLVVIFSAMDSADAFAILQQIGKWNAPHPSSPFGPAPSSSSTAIALVPTQAQQFNDMLLKFNQPQSEYVMTKPEALELIAKTYPGQIEVTANERITDWQAAKHLYHARGVGVDPEMYGITQEQLMEIGKPGGLPEYVRKGEHVKASQEALKNICENSQKRTDSKYYYKHGVTPATVYYDEDNRLIVSFNQKTGDLITGDRQRENVFNRFMADNTLGGLKWIVKWGNN